MKIYLARHGETDWNKNGKIMGQTDIPLNEVGLGQAKQLSEKLKDVEFSVCYSSPLRRAHTTAEIITRNQCKIVDDDLLKEKFCGKNEGKTDLEADWNDESMETDEEIFARAEKFFEKIKKLNDEKNILVVSHMGLIKRLHRIILNLDEEAKLKWGNCEFRIYEIKL